MDRVDTGKTSAILVAPKMVYFLHHDTSDTNCKARTPLSSSDADVAEAVDADAVAAEY